MYIGERVHNKLDRDRLMTLSLFSYRQGGPLAVVVVFLKGMPRTDHAFELR